MKRLPAFVKPNQPIRASWGNDIVSSLRTNENYPLEHKFIREGNPNPFCPIFIDYSGENWYFKIQPGFIMEYLCDPDLEAVKRHSIYISDIPLTDYPPIKAETNETLCAKFHVDSTAHNAIDPSYSYYPPYHSPAIIWIDGTGWDAPITGTNVPVAEAWDDEELLIDPAPQDGDIVIPLLSVSITGDSIKFLQLHPSNIYWQPAPRYSHRDGGNVGGATEILFEGEDGIQPEGENFQFRTLTGEVSAVYPEDTGNNQIHIAVEYDSAAAQDRVTEDDTWVTNPVIKVHHEEPTNNGSLAFINCESGVEYTLEWTHGWIQNAGDSTIQLGNCSSGSGCVSGWWGDCTWQFLDYVYEVTYGLTQHFENGCLKNVTVSGNASLNGAGTQASPGDALFTSYIYT